MMTSNDVFLRALRQIESVHTGDDRLRDAVSTESILLERLSKQEQVRATIVPLVIAHIAWYFADKVTSIAAQQRVSILKKLSREVKSLRHDYDYRMRNSMSHSNIKEVEEQIKMFESIIGMDIQILYFSVNNEFKRTMPNYPHDELRTYAIMSVLFIDYLQEYNNKMSDMLLERIPEKNLSRIPVSPVLEKLRKVMELVSGVSKKFNYKDRNIVLSMAVIKNRVNGIEFSVLE